MVPVAEVSVVDIVPVVPGADVPLVDRVTVLAVDPVSVAVVMDVSVAAVSVFVFSSFLHATANMPASASARSVRANDFFMGCKTLLGVNCAARMELTSAVI
jgi:hypothetical protein